MPIKSRGKLYTYSGCISFPGGAPSLLDIAVSLSRECRYVGNGQEWWPVALHCFVVADLLPPSLKLHGLLHDASECITGDIPRPVKTAAIKRLEDRIMRSIYTNFGLRLPTLTQHVRIKEADDRALRGEVYTVGTRALQAVYPQDDEAKKLVLHYAEKYPPLECLNANGATATEFMKRFHLYSR